MDFWHRCQCGCVCVCVHVCACTYVRYNSTYVGRVVPVHVSREISCSHRKRDSPLEIVVTVDEVDVSLVEDGSPLERCSYTGEAGQF